MLAGRILLVIIVLGIFVGFFLLLELSPTKNSDKEKDKPKT